MIYRMLHNYHWNILFWDVSFTRLGIYLWKNFLCGRRFPFLMFFFLRLQVVILFFPTKRDITTRYLTMREQIIRSLLWNRLAFNMWYQSHPLIYYRYVIHWTCNCFVNNWNCLLSILRSTIFYWTLVTRYSRNKNVWP